MSVIKSIKSNLISSYAKNPSPRPANNTASTINHGSRFIVSSPVKSNIIVTNSRDQFNVKNSVSNARENLEDVSVTYQVSNKSSDVEKTKSALKASVDKEEDSKQNKHANTKGAGVEMEVVTSDINRLLLRDIHDGTLHKAEVLNTTVSANGHVVKTVKSKSFGITTIVDDQADVELERANLADKRKSHEENKVESQSNQTSCAPVTTGVTSLPVISSSASPAPSTSLPMSLMTSSGIVPMTADMSSGDMPIINSGVPAAFHQHMNSSEGGLSLQGNHGVGQMCVLEQSLPVKVVSDATSLPLINTNSGTIPFTIVNMDGGQTVLSSTDISVLTGAQDGSTSASATNNNIHSVSVSDMCGAPSASAPISSVQVSVLNVDQQHQHVVQHQHHPLPSQQLYLPPPDLQGNNGMLMSPEDPLRHTALMSPENQDYEAELSPESVLDDITPKPKIKKTKKRRFSSESGDNDGGGIKGCGGGNKCYVCGDKAGPHSYYGGQVCTSCRAFFRRTVISRTKDTYFCLKNGDCDINLKTRKTCQFCRYEKCIKAGMKASWVQEKDQNQKMKTEDESCSKRTKYTNSISTSTVSSDDGEAMGESEDLIYITADEMNTIDKLVHNWELHANNKMFDMETQLIKDIIRMVSFGKDMTATGLFQLTKTLKNRLSKAVSNIQDIHSLCQEDKNEILNQNLPLLVKLNISVIMQPEVPWPKQLESLLGASDILMLKNKLIEKEAADVKSVRYDQIFNCILKNPEIEQEEEFIKVMSEMSDWPADVKELVLISMLILFCSTSLQLKDRSRIDDIQAHFGEILCNYLRHRHGKEKGRAKFGRAVHLINKCQRLHVLEHKHFPVVN